MNGESQRDNLSISPIILSISLSGIGLPDESHPALGTTLTAITESVALCQALHACPKDPLPNNANNSSSFDLSTDLLRSIFLIAICISCAYLYLMLHLSMRIFFCLLPVSV